MTNLEIAIQHYPVGTKFKSAYSGDTKTSTGEFTIHRDNNICVTTQCLDDCFVYYNGNWAEIISKPEFINSYQIY